MDACSKVWVKRVFPIQIVFDDSSGNYPVNLQYSTNEHTFDWFYRSHGIVAIVVKFILKWKFNSVHSKTSFDLANDWMFNALAMWGWHGCHGRAKCWQTILYILESSSSMFSMFSQHIWCICFTHDVSAIWCEGESKQFFVPKTERLELVNYIAHCKDTRTHTNWWGATQKRQNKLIIIELSCGRCEYYLFIVKMLHKIHSIGTLPKTIRTAVHFHFIPMASISVLLCDTL